MAFGYLNMISNHCHCSRCPQYFFVSSCSTVLQNTCWPPVSHYLYSSLLCYWVIPTSAFVAVPVSLFTFCDPLCFLRSSTCLLHACVLVFMQTNHSLWREQTYSWKLWLFTGTFVWPYSAKKTFIWVVLHKICWWAVEKVWGPLHLLSLCGLNSVCGCSHSKSSVSAFIYYQVGWDLCIVL